MLEASATDGTLHCCPSEDMASLAPVFPGTLPEVLSTVAKTTVFRFQPLKPMRARAVMVSLNGSASSLRLVQNSSSLLPRQEWQDPRSYQR